MDFMVKIIRLCTQILQLHDLVTAFSVAKCRSNAEGIPSSLCNVTLTLRGLLTLVDLDGGATRFGLAFYDKNDRTCRWPSF